MGIELELNTTRPPLVCIVPTSANITIHSAVNVNAIGYNGSRALAFVLGMVRTHGCVHSHISTCMCISTTFVCVCVCVCVLHLAEDNGGSETSIALPGIKIFHLCRFGEF